MSEQNKPQWLIDAEKELKKFNDSKYANMTDAQIASAIGGANAQTRYNSEYQSEMGKRGGKKGGLAAHAAMIAKYGEQGYKDRMKAFYDSRDNTKFHSEGGKIGGKINGPKTGKLAVESGQLAAARINSKKSLRDKRQKMCDEVYNLLPDGWFSKNEALELIPYSYKQFGRIIREYDADRYEIKGQSSKTRYRKRAI